MPSVGKYIIVRSLIAIPMIFILLTTVFIVLRVMPGDPVSAILGEKAPEEYKEALRKKLGMDKPYHIQYLNYLSNLLRGDFRTSILTERPVLEELFERFPATLELTIGSLLVALPIGVFGGMKAAYRRNTKIDHAIRSYAIVAWTLFIPFLGAIFQWIFSITLHILPTSGRLDPMMVPPKVTGLYTIDSLLAGDIYAFIESIRHLILPSLTLGIVMSGAFVRIIRENMIVVLKKDFITAARARGVPENQILWRHAMKNTMIPFITIFGLIFALLLAGAVLTETTFSWPGIGRYLVERIYYRDYPAIQGAVVLYAIIVVVINLFVDIVYAFIDPRIRY